MVKERTEKQSDITKGIDKRTRQIDDRVKHIDSIVSERSALSEASQKLRIATTSEGARAFIKAITQASEAIANEFGNQKKDLEGKLKESEKAEEDLRQRTVDARKDARQTGVVQNKLKEVKGAHDHIARAQTAAINDANFVEQQRKRQGRIRIIRQEQHVLQKRQFIGATIVLHSGNYGPLIPGKQYIVKPSEPVTKEEMPLERRFTTFQTLQDDEIESRKPRKPKYISDTPEEYNTKKNTYNRTPNSEYND